MRKIEITNRFRKDHKRLLKRGCNDKKIKSIIELLATDNTLPASARPHRLSGEYVGKWDLHIEPDWILIYEIDDADVLVLYRTGSHSDLFK